jgi:hypothetical protein
MCEPNKANMTKPRNASTTTTILKTHSKTGRGAAPNVRVEAQLAYIPIRGESAASRPWNALIVRIDSASDRIDADRTCSEDTWDLEGTPEKARIGSQRGNDGSMICYGEGGSEESSRAG